MSVFYNSLYINELAAVFLFPKSSLSRSVQARKKFHRELLVFQQATAINGNLTAAGLVTQGAGDNLIVAGTTNINAGGNPINLNEAGNDFQSAVTLATTGAITASGAATQGGALSVSGNTSIGAGATNDITLTNGSNDFGGGVRIVTGLNVSSQDANAILLGNASGDSNVSGALAVTSSGAITR